MKQEIIKELFEKFESACKITDGIECWSAREIQELFHYTEWRNFLKVIEKAKRACNNAGVETLDHFVGFNKTIKMPKNAEKEIEDIALTRYACYNENRGTRITQISSNFHLISFLFCHSRGGSGNPEYI